MYKAYKIRKLTVQSMQQPKKKKNQKIVSWNNFAENNSNFRDEQPELLQKDSNIYI